MQTCHVIFTVNNLILWVKGCNCKNKRYSLQLSLCIISKAFLSRDKLREQVVHGKRLALRLPILNYLSITSYFCYMLLPNFEFWLAQCNVLLVRLMVVVKPKADFQRSYSFNSCCLKKQYFFIYKDILHSFIIWRWK